MRKQWILVWTLAGISAGCAGPGGPGGAYVAQGPQQAQQFAAQQGLPPQQNPSMTQKVTSFFRPGENPGAPHGAGQVPAVQNQVDTLSLGYKSTAPNAQLYLSMGKVSDHSGHTAHAREMYQKALAVEPRSLEALLALARLEDREGNLNVALGIYQQAAAAHPQDAGALNDLALCLARTGQLQPSLGLLQQAVQLRPDKALYRNNIAKVLAGMNRSGEALQHLSAAHPPAVAQYNLGVLLHQLGRSGEAQQHLIAATNIDPQMQAPRTLLAQLGVAPAGAVVQSNGLAPAIKTDDSILPTPRTPPAGYAAGVQQYPNTGAYSNLPVPQSVPGATARMPAGTSPMLLPPVR